MFPLCLLISWRGRGLNAVAVMQTPTFWTRQQRSSVWLLAGRSFVSPGVIHPCVLVFFSSDTRVVGAPEQQTGKTTQKSSRAGVGESSGQLCVEVGLAGMHRVHHFCFAPALACSTLFLSPSRQICIWYGMFHVRSVTAWLSPAVCPPFLPTPSTTRSSFFYFFILRINTPKIPTRLPARSDEGVRANSLYFFLKVASPSLRSLSSDLGQRSESIEPAKGGYYFFRGELNLGP